MNLSDFFQELKRRNVYKVAVAYIVAGWALSQGIAPVFPVFDVPNWIIRSMVVLIILGLPVALVLAWMFELTPQGIKRTETADAMPAATRQKKHAWIFVVVVAGAISLGLFFLGRLAGLARRKHQNKRLLRNYSYREKFRSVSSDLDCQTPPVYAIKRGLTSALHEYSPRNQSHRVQSSRVRHRFAAGNDESVRNKGDYPPIRISITSLRAGSLTDLRQAAASLPCCG